MQADLSEKKKMPRKNNSKNPLQIRIEAVSVPKRMAKKPELYLKALLHTVRTGESLPRGMEVNLWWRNPGTKKGKSRHWRDDDFEDALSESTVGFRAVVHDVILKKLRGGQ